jgi:hypothetical protein
MPEISDLTPLARWALRLPVAQLGYELLAEDVPDAELMRRAATLGVEDIVVGKRDTALAQILCECWGILDVKIRR